MNRDDLVFGLLQFLVLGGAVVVSCVIGSLLFSDPDEEEDDDDFGEYGGEGRHYLRRLREAPRG